MRIAPPSTVSDSSMQPASSLISRKHSSLKPSSAVLPVAASAGSDTVPPSQEALTHFSYVHVGKLQVYGSFKGTRSIEDILGVTIVIHAKKYSNRTCTKTAMLKKLRNDVVSDLLQQVRAHALSQRRRCHNVIAAMIGWSQRSNIVELCFTSSWPSAWYAWRR